jgi:hypothetical protein
MDLTFPTLKNFPTWVIIGQGQTIWKYRYLPFITSSCTKQILIGLNKRSSHLVAHLSVKIVQIYLNKNYILFNHRPKEPNEILRATITFSQKDLEKSLKWHVSLSKGIIPSSRKKAKAQPDYWVDGRASTHPFWWKEPYHQLPPIFRKEN